MKYFKLRVAIMMFTASTSIAASLALAAPASAIRFCCTPQQSAACAAKGGTASCRTSNLCQCLF